jgi:hypothetical protein
MKGKITIVLFSLVLVFGMLAASCDNGAYPDQLDGDDSTYLAYTSDGRNLPVADVKEVNGKVVLDGNPPVRLKSDAVYAKLQETTTKWSTDGKSYTIVKSYILSKVSTAAPKGQAAYDADELKKAGFFAGMPIVIQNPELIP